MNFERFAGMASVAGFVLIFAITMWTGLWGPLWQNIGGAEILNLFVAIIGWVVTVGIGWRAFVLSQRQIALGREQIAIQQGQIRDTQADVAQASFLRLNAEVDELGHDIDKLMTASGYLDKLIERFPNQGRVDGWAKALLEARRVGVDSLSQSAAGAPFGYGARVMTVINRLQRMGDVMFNEITTKSIPMEGQQCTGTLTSRKQSKVSACCPLRSRRRYLDDNPNCRRAQISEIFLGLTRETCDLRENDLSMPA
jgi:hypothetical protein